MSGKSKSGGGEGNHEADRAYRKGVRETVEKTSTRERAQKARDMDEAEREQARRAEERARSRSRS